MPVASEKEQFALGRLYYRLRADVLRYEARGMGSDRDRQQWALELKKRRRAYEDAGGVV
jgi:hypothetical protein